MKKSISKLFKYMSRHKVPTRILSLFLSVLMIFYVIPTVVYGEIAEAFKSEEAAETETSVTDNGYDYTYSSDVYEVEALREESVKHFHLEDGSYVAAQYAYPVHYRDEGGNLVDIDNTLTEASGGVFANPNARIKFAKKITGNETLFALHDGNTKLTFSLVGAKKKTVGTVYNNADAESDTKLQKLMNLEKLSSRIVYEDILDGVDLEYVAESLNIKENIIVKERSDSYAYIFELKLNGLDAELLNDGSISIKDTQTNERKYVIPAPTVFDSAYEYAPDGKAAYTLTGSGNGKYTLTVSVDSAWMNDSARVFPVTVDPAVQSDLFNTFLEMTSISSAAGMEFYSSANNTGRYHQVSPEFTTYVKIDGLPTIPQGSYTKQALLYIRGELPNSNIVPQMFIHEVTTGWNENSLTYSSHVSNNRGAYGTSSVAINNATLGSSYHWDITNTVRRWVTGAIPNYGLAIVANSAFWTANGLGSNAVKLYEPPLPYLSINYVKNTGIEDYLTYSSQSAGMAGSSSVSHSTGNLTLSAPLVSTVDSLMPITASLVYNGTYANKSHKYPDVETAYTQSFLPYGFNLNLCENIIQKVHSVSSSDRSRLTYYVYEDADGTNHAFMANSSGYGTFTDEDALQMTMTVTTINSITLTDDSKIVKTFTKVTFPTASESDDVTYGWVLTSIEDEYGNKITIAYDSTNVRPTSVTLTPNGSAAITTLHFLYRSSGMLYAIYNSASGDFALLRYSSTYSGAISTSSEKYLRRIEFGHFASDVNTSELSSAYTNTSYVSSSMSIDYKVNYSYSSAGRITVANDSTSKQKLSYTYATTSGKVTKVEHYAYDDSNNQTLGGSLSFSYGTGYTDVTSTGNDEQLGTADDIVTRYIFDDRGRSVSSYSYSKNGTEIYGAVTGVYETEECIKNNLKEKTVLSGSSGNYLLNGDFESPANANSFDFWTLSGSVERDNQNVEGRGRYSARFYPTAGASASITQYVHLDSGNYTLSMPIKVQSADGISGSVKITSVASSGFSHTEAININPNVTNGISSFFTTSFTVSEHINGGDNLKVVIEFVADADATYTPTIHVDNVSIENALGASSFSYVEGGSFDTSSITSSGSTNAAISELWESDLAGGSITVVTDEGPFGNAIKLSASTGTEAKQRVYAITAEDIYRFGAYSAGEYTNAKGEFIISGFAKAADTLSSDTATFRLRVDIAYYQGESEDDVIKSYYFDFVPTVEGWQFTMGSFNLAYERGENDTNAYDRIEYIDVVCEYANQPNGPAYFDNISLIATDGSNTEKYYYYTSDGLEGLLARKQSLFYEEFYFYNSDRNVVRIANNKGELTDYYYNDDNNKNKLSYTVDYDFTWNGGYSYPLRELVEGDPEIKTTVKTKTEYQYNDYGQCTVTQTYTVDNTLNQTDGEGAIYTERLYNTTSGSYTFGALLTEKDGSGTETRYYYDSNDGKLLASINTNTGEGICYVYDSADKLTSVKPATYVSNSLYLSVPNVENVTYTYDQADRISTISTDSTTYTFGYDVFGNTTGISAGDKQLATYTYNDNNGKLNKITYGNGYIEEYVYNDLEMLTEVWYTNGTGTKTKAYSYEYTASGLVHKFANHMTGKNTVYKYDSNNRLLSFIEYDTDDMSNDYSSLLQYNSQGQLSYVGFELNHLNGSAVDASGWYYVHIYDPDGIITSTTVHTAASSGEDVYTYDVYDRVFERINTQISDEDPSKVFKNEVTYSYLSKDTYTTHLVSRYDSDINDEDSETYTFTYDGKGNITKIVTSDGTQIRYVYDDLGQLIREDNGQLGETYLYTYDNAGNITSRNTYALTAANVTPTTPITTKTYGYSNGTWGDLLTSYNGTAITYDGIGNPLSYYNGVSYSFSWTGRRLTGLVKSGITYSFTYNDEGIRTSKTKNGVTTTYYLNGSQIVAEETSGNVTVYLYDETGLPIGMQYHGASYAEDAWDVFWYEKNLQGDIVAVYNESGTKLISYKYDAYGRCFSTQHNGGYSTQAYNNPFRYRGYYYDRDLELYYLNSRYYDSYTGRFISADGYVSTGQGLTGYNMYAYCNNNPVNRVDYTGQFWSEILEFAKIAVTEIGKAMVLISPAYAGCSGVAVGDGPLPFGDIVALAGAALLTIGAVGYGIYQATQAPTISIPKTEEKTEATPATSTVIYRYGGTNPGNLTPKSKDMHSGLSFSTVPMPGAAMTTIEALNATGVVYAVQDGATHVSVKPVGTTTEEWINAGSDSIWTRAVKSVVIKWDGGY